MLISNDALTLIAESRDATRPVLL